MDEQSSLVQNYGTSGPNSPQFPELSSNNNWNLLKIAFVGVVAIMSVITFLLSVYRGFESDHIGGIYFMLGLIHFCFALLECLLYVFASRQELQGDRTMFFYSIGVLSIFHSVFTNIVLFGD